MRISFVAALLVTASGSLAYADDCCCNNYYGQGAASGRAGFQLGVLTRGFDNALDSLQSGELSLGGSSYWFQGATDGRRETSDSLTSRLDFRMGSHFYMGWDFELGKVLGAVHPDNLTGFGAQPTITQGSSYLFGTDLAFGFNEKITEQLEVGAEVGFGMRVVSYGFKGELEGDTDTAHLVALSPTVEGRLRAGAWLDSTTLLSATVGKSFLDDGRVVGVSIGWYTDPPKEEI
ncbi:MAG TPA: hypothetical protein VGM39_23145 [Kofleriaceae bacterium]